VFGTPSTSLGGFVTGLVMFRYNSIYLTGLTWIANGVNSADITGNVIDSVNESTDMISWPYTSSKLYSAYNSIKVTGGAASSAVYLYSSMTSELFSTYNVINGGGRIGAKFSYVSKAFIYGDVYNNCITAILVDGPAYVNATASGTGNTTAVYAANGANVFIKSTSTITGTTEISLDGVAHTLAEMRAQTPKYLTNATTGTRVWGD
jgi:hypothetical protein